MTVSQIELTHAHQPATSSLLSNLPGIVLAGFVVAVVVAGWVALFLFVPVQVMPLRVG